MYPLGAKPVPLDSLVCFTVLAIADQLANLPQRGDEAALGSRGQACPKREALGWDGDRPGWWAAAVERRG